MELTIVGLQNSGKTTLVNLITTGKYEEDTLSTIGFNMKKITRGNVVMKLWDVGGQPRFRGMWDRYCHGVTAIVFVVDASDYEKVDNARNELMELISKRQLEGIPLLIAGNKCDLPEHMSETELSEAMGLNDIEDRDIGVFMISAKENINVDDVLEWLMSKSK